MFNPPSFIISGRASLVALALGVAVAGCRSTDPAGLTDPDPDVRRERLAAIGEAAIDEPGDRAMVATATSSALAVLDPGLELHAGVRATGHRVLEGLRPPEAATALGASARDPGLEPSPWARSAAASALGAIGGPVAVDALRRALRGDPSQDVRLAAARELGELEDPSGLTTEALLEALRDEAASVRLNARRALRRIHASDLGLDPETWRAWLDARGWQPPPSPLPGPTPLPPAGDPWGGGDAPDEGAPGAGEAPAADDEEPVDAPLEQPADAPDEGDGGR